MHLSRVKNTCKKIYRFRNYEKGYLKPGTPNYTMKACT